MGFNSAFKGLKLLKKTRERAFKQFKQFKQFKWPRPQCVKITLDVLQVRASSYDSNNSTTQNATVSQIYYLTFMCGATCFGRLPAHHQERTTAVGASGFTVGAWRLERCWSWSGRPRPTTLQPPHSNGKTRGFYCSCTLLWWAERLPKHIEPHMNVK